MKRIALAVGIVLITVLVLALGLRELLDGPAPKTSATLSLTALAAAADRFPAPADRPLRWPADHGAHPEQFGEYWLFAGWLDGPDDRRFGFQLALFRIGLRLDVPQIDSAWASRQLYRAHLVLSDYRSAEVAVEERYSRAALGLSGARHDPIRIWLEDWQVGFDAPTRTFRLQAGLGDRTLTLHLQAGTSVPVALSGPGYRGYWLPRLTATGTLRFAGDTFEVSGGALLDRIWGRALPLGRGQLSLNRLWLQLDDGSVVRCRQLRRREGGGTPIGECLWRDAGNRLSRFDRREMTLVPEATWEDPDSGARYPLNWRLTVPTLRLNLAVTPVLDDQALDFALPLWSGAVAADGRFGDAKIRGRGLLELSNYVPTAEP